MDIREQTLRQWLVSVCVDPIRSIDVLPVDASCRKYYRVTFSDTSLIAMDAPPSFESVEPFILRASVLSAAGVLVPEIVACDFESGFLLITDFGDQLLSTVLTLENADAHYKTALRALVRIHQCEQTPGYKVPCLDAECMRQEMQDFQYWYLERHVGCQMTAALQASLAACFEQIVSFIDSQPRVLIHRDFHSRNLLLLSDDRVGVIDFQDAMPGPMTYDVVSLLRDCYIAWPKEKVIKLALYYYQLAREARLLTRSNSAEQYLQWFDWMGLQRQMKAIATFARKSHREGRDEYLKYIPQALQYLIEVSGDYAALKNFQQSLLSAIKVEEYA